MRWVAGIAVAWLTLGMAPCRAQFQDLIRKYKEVPPLPPTEVTLDLREAKTEDAVAKLAEALGTTLSCAPKLAGMRVTLIARQRPAAEVGEALACAVQGRWRKEGDGAVLEPADPRHVLSIAEFGAELGYALSVLRPPPGIDTGEANRELFGSFDAQQLRDMESPQGLPAAQLTPEQRERLSWILASPLGNGLKHLSRLAGLAGDLSKLRVALPKPSQWVGTGTPPESLEVEGMGPVPFLPYLPKP